MTDIKQWAHEEIEKIELGGRPDALTALVLLRRLLGDGERLERERNQWQTTAYDLDKCLGERDELIREAYSHRGYTQGHTPYTCLCGWPCDDRDEWNEHYIASMADVFSGPYVEGIAGETP